MKMILLIGNLAIRKLVSIIVISAVILEQAGIDAMDPDGFGYVIMKSGILTV